MRLRQQQIKPWRYWNWEAKKSGKQATQLSESPISIMVFYDFDAGFYGTGRRCAGLRFVNFFCTVPWVSIEGSVLHLSRYPRLEPAATRPLGGPTAAVRTRP
jgi:hypothetical protein